MRAVNRTKCRHDNCKKVLSRWWCMSCGLWGAEIWVDKEKGSMSIKEEFEKALEDRRDINSEYYHSDWTTLGVALWAAQWMSEKCAKRADGYSKMPMSELDVKQMTTWGFASTIADSIRQLAKEMI